MTENRTELVCPKCTEKLIEHEKTYTCKNRHSYDKARSGYIHISGKQKTSGDSKEMIDARTRFLETGAYGFLKEEILKIIQNIQPETLVDIGCGQGYYTKDMAQYAQRSYGIDLSKSAIDYAAKHDKKTLYMVGSIYHLPFEKDSIDMIVSIFTPIPEKEILRVLKPGGYFLTVIPGVMHHKELKEILYEKVRLNDEPNTQMEGFELKEYFPIEEKKQVDDLVSLLHMTPYLFKTPKEGIEKLESMKEGKAITFQFVLRLFQKP
jgi:23S rRNA (guanine745-N1)-methyltransferase